MSMVMSLEEEYVRAQERSVGGPKIAALTKTAQEESVWFCTPVDEGVTKEYYFLAASARNYALDAFHQQLNEFEHLGKINLPENFDKIMQNPYGVLPRKTQFQLMNLPQHKKRELVSAMAEAVHDGWVKDNPEYFFNEKYADERFVYLRIELCCLEVYCRCLNLIHCLVQQLGLDFDSWQYELEMMFLEKRREFVRQYRLTNENLAEYVATIGKDYLALSPKISSSLRRNRSLANEVATQVIMHAPLRKIDFF